MKKYILFISLSVVMLITSCTKNDNHNSVAPTISINQDSEYANTFKELNLGILFEFNFYLPNADKRWVNLWVERYKEGNKDPRPLTELSYGSSPKEVTQGRLGFGMINPNLNDTSVFLFAPGVSSPPSLIEKELNPNIKISTWDYAFGQDEVELELGETYILAAYRETERNSIKMIDLQAKDSVDQMIKRDDMVLLLKIKVQENP
ncbi:hypothetical protein GCM10008967_32210 [Bacillus carboniphilus]|uniref:Lipoprotein n=1 Tax=Bacillus carboniphilus TaxID=86663 RepID=A0ABP3GB47_9BACI